ncbi:hypothetical protein ACJJTC_007083 [Scirpophaga incertulas]
MTNKIVICVFILSFYQCNCHNSGPSLLDGILSGAQNIGSKVNEVISGLAQGELNLNFQGHVSHPTHHHGHYKPKPPGPPPPPRPEEQTETIVVVVEEEQQPSQGGQQYQQYGLPGYNNYYNNYRPEFMNKPGYGGYNHYNYQPQDNHRPPHHHHNHNKPGYNYYHNPQGQGNQYNNGNQYGYNNEHQSKPVTETTKAPVQNPDHNNYDPLKESGVDKKPNYNDNVHSTTEKPSKDDLPLFVPLNPNQYTYGGDKIEINAPKRETSENTKPEDPKPADDDEAYPIDIRLGDKL